MWCTVWWACLRNCTYSPPLKNLHGVTCYRTVTFTVTVLSFIFSLTWFITINNLQHTSQQDLLHSSFFPMHSCAFRFGMCKQGLALLNSMYSHGAYLYWMSIRNDGNLVVCTGGWKVWVRMGISTNIRFIRRSLVNYTPRNFISYQMPIICLQCLFMWCFEAPSLT